MMINANKPEKWKEDIVRSVDFYNTWFLHFAPSTYRQIREQTTEQVLTAFKITQNFQNVTPKALLQHPETLQIWRMATAPPLARDRLIGLAQVSANLVKNLEQKNRTPPRMNRAESQEQMEKISQVIIRLLDNDILPWLKIHVPPTQEEIFRAATVIADRLCGAISDPIIRNAQEQRQLATIQRWLEAKGYQKLESRQGITFDTMPQGTFALRMDIPVQQQGRSKTVNISIDTIIMPKKDSQDDYPILVEAKSAGDFTNTNKRRKEEAAKVHQLRSTYGKDIRFVLFLCGYFDSGYLGYEAAEGIDWVWEHRIDDLALFGI